MTLDGFDAAALLAMHEQAGRRADELSAQAAGISRRQLRAASADDAWRELDAQWEILMSAEAEQVELMGAIADELERRDSEETRRGR